jgi:hypothetical protein
MYAEPCTCKFDRSLHNRTQKQCCVSTVNTTLTHYRRRIVWNVNKVRLELSVDYIKYNVQYCQRLFRQSRRWCLVLYLVPAHTLSMPQTLMPIWLQYWRTCLEFFAYSILWLTLLLGIRRKNSRPYPQFLRIFFYDANFCHSWEHYLACQSCARSLLCRTLLPPVENKTLTTTLPAVLAQTVFYSTHFFATVGKQTADTFATIWEQDTTGDIACSSCAYSLLWRTLLLLVENKTPLTTLPAVLADVVFYVAQFCY